MRNIVSICLVLIITTFVYMQVGNYQFINSDDNAYVTNNPHVSSGLTGENIAWAFHSVYAGNWHPITWLSHMADAQLYGLNPRGHHLSSVAIHIASTMLLFFLLLRLTGTLFQSLFVAALFALHPLHVESVAWVAERKDVLSGFFWFLTIFLYAEYVAEQRPALYLLALCSFVLGLMSKPMLVTLPIVLILIDFWPLGRYKLELTQGPRQLIKKAVALAKEKVPFFLCSLMSGIITIYAQHNAGAIQGLLYKPFWLRIENALTAYIKYICKTIWPLDLAVYYPFSLPIPLWHVICSLIILLLLSVVAIRSGRHHPYFAVGWFWFLITLVPVIGLIQVGGQSMADRYSYLPVTGLFIIVAWGVPDLVKGMRNRQSILALLAGVVISISAILTWQQLGYWQDSISLYRHTLKVTTGNYFIHTNLGAALAEKEDLDAAIREYQEALRINSGLAEAHNNLGIAYYIKGDLNAAIREFMYTLFINPNFADTHNKLGVALARKGNLDAALQEFQKELRINPNNQGAEKNLKLALENNKAGKMVSP